MGGEEGFFARCLEYTSKLKVDGSIGKVEEEADAVAKQADSPVKVKVIFGDDFTVELYVA